MQMDPAIVVQIQHDKYLFSEKHKKPCVEIQRKHLLGFDVNIKKRLKMQLEAGTNEYLCDSVGLYRNISLKSVSRIPGMFRKNSQQDQFSDLCYGMEHQGLSK